MCLTRALTPAGGVLSEFTVARSGPTLAYPTPVAATEKIDLDLLVGHAEAHDVKITNVTEEPLLIGFMGPKTPSVMRDLGVGDFV